MKKTITYILLNIASLFWGASFILTKEIFTSIPQISVLQLITMRLIAASLVMIPLLAIGGKLEKIKTEDLKWFFLLSLSEPFLYCILETSGVRRVSATLASVVIATIPIFVTLASAAFLRERLRMLHVVGAILSFIGIVIMVMNNGEHILDPGSDGNLAVGLMFLGGAIVIAVVYTLLLCHIASRYRATTITAYQNLISLVYYIPAMLLIDGTSIFALQLTPKVVVFILLLGVFCSTLAYIFYSHGVQQLGPSSACIFNNTIPIFSLLAAVIIGQEEFGWTKLAGVVVVIVGATFAQIEPKKKDLTTNQIESL